MNAQRREIAARLRTLVAGGEDQDLASVAARLGVDEASLAMSLDEHAPDPTIDVMVAVIAAYGVDATWLLTGTYDAATHRRVLEGDAQEVSDVILRLAVDGAIKPVIAKPTDERPRPNGG